MNEKQKYIDRKSETSSGRNKDRRIFSGDGADGMVEMGMIRVIHESLKSIFTWSSIFPDHLEQMQMFLRNTLQTDEPTD